MPCSKEALVSLFHNLSTSSFLLFLFLYSSSVLLFNLLNFIGSYPLFHRHQNEYEYGLYSEEEEEEEGEEEEEEEEDEEEEYKYKHSHYCRVVGCRDKLDQHLVADIIEGGEHLKFLHSNTPEDFTSSGNSMNYDYDYQPVITTTTEDDDEHSSSYYSTEPPSGGYDDNDHQSESEQHNDHEEDSFQQSKVSANKDADSVSNFESTQKGPTSTIEELHNKIDGTLEHCDRVEVNGDKEEGNFPRGEKILVFAPRKLESRRLIVDEKEEDEEEIFGDSCTVGSTSKSSSDWRSSIRRDSATEDPFSSSSRRSCPKWESYTVFQKYDEEMMFLDRISAQKLHETESLRSIQVCPRSISERLVHKIATMKKKEAANTLHNPYRELEATYVAQICLTWEALNWNYKNFQSKRALRRDFDPGCSASIAQQFQQFQVLLQRYIENEPYEQGRRPEVYARMRLLAPKLLLVPEYRDSDEDEPRDEGFGSRISTAAFLMIMEDGIRTFMNFLKADKERACQIIKSFFGRSKRGSVDPTLLNLMKKVNTKKKMKLKELRRGGKCIRRRKLKVEEEMEIEMGQIDLKLVSRVLRMKDLSEEQLHWCEEKMSKVRVMDGKLQRDSSPLFFPPTH